MFSILAANAAEPVPRSLGSVLELWQCLRRCSETNKGTNKGSPPPRLCNTAQQLREKFKSHNTLRNYDNGRADQNRGMLQETNRKLEDPKNHVLIETIKIEQSMHYTQ